MARALSWDGIAPSERDGGQEPDISELRARLATAEANHSVEPLALFEALTRLAQRPEVDGEETRGLLLRAIVAARRPDVAPNLDPLRIASILYLHASPGNAEQGAVEAQRLVDHPVAREDPRVGAAMRLMLANIHYYAGRYSDSITLIDEALAASPALGPELRAEAIGLQVVVRAALGDWDGARAARLALGPEAPRCGTSPRAFPFNTNGRDFPREAQRWGFEGWARVEGAVAQDGVLSEPRTIIGYPAFVFNNAAESLAARFALAPTLTGDGRPCYYSRQIRFSLAP